MTVRIFGLFLIAIMMGQAGCGGDSGGNGTTRVVTVTNWSGSALQGVTVVLGDSNGAMQASRVTGETGTVTFVNAPDNATITAALTCVVPIEGKTMNSLDVRYDVNEPVTIQLKDCSPSFGIPPPPTSTGALGTVIVNVTNTIPGVTRNTLSLGWPVYPEYDALITQQTITIMPYDLQEDGKLSIYVIGKDADGAALGYGMILDQPFEDGMSVNIAVDQPMSSIQYHLTNLPFTVNFLCAGILQRRAGKGSVWGDRCVSLSSSVATTTVSVPYISGLGDQFSFSAHAFSDQQTADSSVTTYQYLSLGLTTTLADQNIDFSQALTTPTLSVADANTATPALMWTGLDPAATSINLHARYLFNQDIAWSLLLPGLSPKRTSIRFPELPDSLAVFRPRGINYFAIDTQAVSDVFRISGSSYFNLHAYAIPALNKAALQARQAFQRKLQHQRPAFR